MVELNFSPGHIPKSFVEYMYQNVPNMRATDKKIKNW